MEKMMQGSLKPDNETERLIALRSLNILDTEPEERFDRYTRICTKLFDVPIALVSLIEDERQWIKSRHGLEVIESPRNLSFCTHVVLDGEPLVVENTLDDARFAQNEFVINAPHLRFYAGYPLFHPDGSCLGTLCIMDYRARCFTDQDRSTLSDMAIMVQRELSATHLATQCDRTQMSNRNGFISASHQVFSVCGREQIPVSIVFFDVKNLDEIKEGYGGSEADLVLRTFAQLLKDSFRNSDLVARLDEHEFVALLTSSNAAQAQEAIDRFQMSVSQYKALSEKSYNVEFSSGAVSIIPDSEEALETLLSRADDLMHHYSDAKAHAIL